MIWREHFGLDGTRWVDVASEDVSNINELRNEYLEQERARLRGYVVESDRLMLNL